MENAAVAATIRKVIPIMERKILCIAMALSPIAAL